MRLTSSAGAAIRRLLLAVALILIPALASNATAQVAPTPDSTGVVTHTVRKGDTLWDIARAYLKNPFRWPEIFRRNTDVVRDPHWIYPGEIIRIPISEVRPEVLETPGVQPAGQSAVVARVQTVATPNTVFLKTPLATVAAGGSAPSPMRPRANGVRPGEVEAAPFVTRLGGPRDHGELLAAVDRPAIQTSAEQARFQLNDMLYVSAPGGTVARVGDTYLAYVLGPELEDIGQIVIPTAILRVEKAATSQPAQARVIRQFGEIRLRQGLLPSPPTPSIPGSPVPVANGIAGKVIHVHEEPILPTVLYYVELSPKLGDGVGIGDEFTLMEDKAGRSDPKPAPPVAAAVVQVVRVTPYGTTGIIVTQAQPSIREGMSARLTAKMR